VDSDVQPEVVLQKLTQHIREEFEEAPGLRLTVGEAARFWGLDLMTCRQVLGRLRDVGFLTAGPDARYGQAAYVNRPGVLRT
jgi:hypothetical protein